MVAVFVMRRRKGKAPESAPEKAPEKPQQNVSDSSSLFQPTAPAQDAPVYAPEPPAEAPPQSEYDSLYGPPPESP